MIGGKVTIGKNVTSMKSNIDSIYSVSNYVRQNIGNIKQIIMKRHYDDDLLLYIVIC